MNCNDLEFRVKTASCGALTAHLGRCNDSFNPPLSSTVNIEEYGKKIFDQAITFEAWDGEELVGLIAAYFNDTETGVGYITNVSVIEAYHGLGIASKLLARASSHGSEKGFTKVALEVEPDNAKALQLYKKHGFVLTDSAETGKKLGMTLAL